MTQEKKHVSVDTLLGLNKFYVDEDNAHIVLDKNLCASCVNKPCLRICPAGLYKLNNGQIAFDYAGCLECGTCRVVCHEIGNKGVIKWEYPNGTFGVHFRCG